uniref:Uncharacterized protein n=1 Tax=Chelydra serpentina TaxID=8475 RepID=A0A8C3RNQ7_CHESE
MAARSRIRDLQEAVFCSFCRDYFKDPVILKCGHNFCRACITQYCKDSKTSPSYACPQCREAFGEGEFQPNRQLKNVVEIAKKFPDPKTCENDTEFLKLFCKVDETPICLVCRETPCHKDHPVVPIEEAIQSRLEHLKEERERILSYKSSGEKTSQELLQKIVSEFRQLYQFLKEQERLLLAQLEDLIKAIEERRDEYVAKLSEEISSFSSLINEMEQKCQQPASEFLQVRQKSPDLSLAELCPSRSDSLSAANVTLDPDTAHPQLVLFENRKTVRWRDAGQAPPDTPERFDTEHCVLGCEGFTSGRHYWEVDVWGFFAVGVVRESVSRKGELSFSPEQGIWVTSGSCAWWPSRTDPEQLNPLPGTETFHRVGVYLDYEAGRVAFVDAHSGDPIFTKSPASFAGERIRPFLRVEPCDGCAQLTLCP